MRRLIYLLGGLCALSALLFSGVQGHCQIGNAALTTVSVSSFHQAREHQVRVLNDGDPLSLWLSLPKPLSRYLGVWTGDKGVLGAEKRGIRITVAEAQAPERLIESSVFLPSFSESGLREFSINLAPGAVRLLPLDCWLRAMASNHPEARTKKYLIRVYGLGNSIFEEKQLLASASVSVDLASGAEAYTQLLKGYLEQMNTGDKAYNDVPPRGQIRDTALAQQIARLAATKIGLPHAVLYFTGCAWQHDWNEFGIVFKDHLPGVLLYAKESRTFYQSVLVNKYQGGKLDVELGYEREIDFDVYQRALANLN